MASQHDAAYRAPARMLRPREPQPALPYRRGAGPRPARRAHRALRSAQRMFATSALVTAAALLGVFGGNTTYALWQDSRSLDPGTLIPAVEGEISLRFAVGDPLAASVSFEHLLPGESQTLPVLLENDGEVALTLTTELDAVSNADFDLRIELDPACTASGYLTESAIGGSAMSVAAPVSLGSIAVGATVKLCVEVTAGTTISPESSVSFDLTLVGASAP